MEAPAPYKTATLNTKPMEPSIETHGGRMVDFDNPDPSVINITDIATALSRTPRFNGHTRIPWSVASHSMLCVDFARQFFKIDDWMALHVLLHDAHEAYTGDIVSPLKHMPQIHRHIKAVEDRLQHAIEIAFGICHPAPSERDFIKMIDEYALAIEAHHMMPSQGQHWNLRAVFSEALELFDEPMSDEQVCRHFIQRYEKYRSNLEFDRRTGVAVA